MEKESIPKDFEFPEEWEFVCMATNGVAQIAENVTDVVNTIWGNIEDNPAYPDDFFFEYEITLDDVMMHPRRESFLRWWARSRTDWIYGAITSLWNIDNTNGEWWTIKRDISEIPINPVLVKFIHNYKGNDTYLRKV